jgi:predicted transcriptional regulator of viral defense system
MKTDILLRKIRMENKEFVTSNELRGYCKPLKLNYDIVIRHFVARGYLVRILKGIFYVKSLEELELGRPKYNHFELVAKGLELKNVRNWYFGLHSALKFNNITHEHFSVEEVINDSLFRANPVKIADHKFKFVKVSPSLLGFGVRKGDNGLKYSDPEKTVLDFIYIWRYNGVPEEKIISDISDWAKKSSKERLRKYAAEYPTTVAQIVKRVIE